jgi:hypothetical protein
MLYRLLRPDEDWQLGVSAKDPNSTKSVFDHVINGSSWEWQSKYIATCGSLNSVLTFRSKSVNPGKIVQISEDNLPVVKIDLRTSSNRSIHYLPGNDSNELIDKFNNYANKFEEVLLVGDVPASHIKPMNESDFVSVQLPE